MALSWSAIGTTESGYVIQHSTDGASFSTIAIVASNVTSYVDNAVTPLTQNYYRVLGTNSVGLGSAGSLTLSGSPIFAASPPVTVLASPWQAQDIGTVLGRGASGQTAGTYTVIGSGSGIGGSSDQFQYASQPIAGNVTITARVTAGQNTGTNALAGVMIRNGLGIGSLDVLLAFNGGTTNSVFQSRTNGGGNAMSTTGPGSLNTPLWVRLVSSGNTVTGYTSPDGSVWTQRGTASVGLESVVYAGLAVSSGTSTLLNSATFDNVTIIGTPATTAPPLAEWKLDETSGAIAVDSRGGYNGGYDNNAVLGLPGATLSTGYSVGLFGNSYLSLPPLNLNNNIVTITAWVKPNGDQAFRAGIVHGDSYPTESGMIYVGGLASVWNGSVDSSGLALPTNQWTFVALVIEPTMRRYYTISGGVLQGVTNLVANVAVPFNGGYIGNSDWGLFNGQFDEVSFFANQALTPEQISQLAAITVNTTPTNIVASVSGNNLTLSWPPDHTGWRLLMQTNNLANGVSSNTNDWGTVAGSSATNQIIAPIDPTKKTEFYRLVYP